MSGLELKAFPIGVAGDQSRVFRIRFEGDARGLIRVLKALQRVLPSVDLNNDEDLRAVYEGILHPMLRVEGEPAGLPSGLITYITRRLLQLSLAFKLGYEEGLKEAGHPG